MDRKKHRDQGIGNNPNITRREFLKSATLGAGALAAELTGKGQEGEHQGQKITARAEYEYLKADREKIDYPKHPKEASQEIRSLIQVVARHVDKIRNVIETQTAAANKLLNEGKKADKKQELQTQNTLSALKQSFWKEAQELVPDIGPYSEESYYRFLASALPRRLAEYGIYAQIFPADAPSGDFESFLASEYRIAFFQVSLRGTDTVSRGGKTIRRDIVSIKKQINPETFAIITPSPKEEGGLASVGRQNIFLNEQILAKPPRVELQDLDAFRSLSQEKIWLILQRAHDQHRQAMVTAIAKILIRPEMAAVSLADEKERALAHETGHLVDDRGEKMTVAFPPRTYTNIEIALRNGANRRTHQEINGLLNELRYSSGTARTLSLSFLVAGAYTYFDHTRAATWIREKIIDAILSNPQAYQVAILPEAEARIPQRIQAFAQMAAVLDHSAQFNTLLEEMMKYHEAHYDEDFSTEYLESIHFLTKQEKKRETPPMKEPGIAWEFIGGIATLATIAAFAVRAFSQRRNIIETEAFFRKLLETVELKGISSDALMKRLQLTVRETQIDPELRASAFSILLRTASKTPTLVPHLKRLSHMMSEQQKKQLEKLEQEHELGE